MLSTKMKMKIITTRSQQQQQQQQKILKTHITKPNKHTLRVIRRNGKAVTLKKSAPFKNVEPFGHIEAKRKVVRAALMFGYDYDNEWRTPELEHKGRNDVVFPIDIRLINCETGDKILLQIDGGYHFKNERNIHKSENRDDTLRQFASKHGYRYVVLREDDILESFDTAWDIIKALGISVYKHNEHH